MNQGTTEAPDRQNGHPGTEYAVGKYRADYSRLSPKEIAQEDPDLTELYANSRIDNRKRVLAGIVDGTDCGASSRMGGGSCEAVTLAIAQLPPLGKDGL